ncbi:MAG: NAD(P)-dependent oxidoreductase [Acetobacteraceae bacterium]
MPSLLAICRVAVDISTIDVAAASAHGVLVTRATPGFVAAVAGAGAGAHDRPGPGRFHRGRGLPGPHGACHPGAGGSCRGRRWASSAMARSPAPGQAQLALGMTVIVNDPYADTGPGIRATTLPTLLEEADFVVCLALATAETRHLMGRRRVQPDAARRVLHQPVARQPGG